MEMRSYPWLFSDLTWAIRTQSSWTFQCERIARFTLILVAGQLSRSRRWLCHDISFIWTANNSHRVSRKCRTIHSQLKTSERVCRGNTITYGRNLLFLVDDGESVRFRVEGGSHRDARCSSGQYASGKLCRTILRVWRTRIEYKCVWW